MVSSLAEPACLLHLVHCWCARLRNERVCSPAKLWEGAGGISLATAAAIRVKLAKLVAMCPRAELARRLWRYWCA